MGQATEETEAKLAAEALAQYPEHEKLKEIQEKSQAIGEFIEFGGYVLCEYKMRDDQEIEDLVQVGKPISEILAEYFEIDQNKLETEKRAMLDLIRNG